MDSPSIYILVICITEETQYMFHCHTLNWSECEKVVSEPPFAEENLEFFQHCCYLYFSQNIMSVGPMIVEPLAPVVTNVTAEQESLASEVSSSSVLVGTPDRMARIDSMLLSRLIESIQTNLTSNLSIRSDVSYNGVERTIQCLRQSGFIMMLKVGIRC